MAFDEGLAERVRDVLVDHPVTEKKMFGGLCFMLRGHMLLGVNADNLMLRVDKGAYSQLLTLPHAREMDFTGRALKGFLYVGEDGYAEDEDLEAWVSRCLTFNATKPAK
ncbi:MAG: TfoX/Sxy family transcriptional regulator of competence genes [Myxococcota bacterium]|jgi:TfoX/Sxy family transcriptional regulator of competence genes